MGHASRVKRSLLLTWEDLKTENIVVLGSPAENFFLRDLPQKQDLIFKPMPDDNGNKSFGIINTNPQPGEQRRYLAKQDGPSRSQISEDYAVVSLLQGLDGKKRMLILAGITTHGTQAAVEYVTKPDYIRDLIRTSQHRAGGRAAEAAVQFPGPGESEGERRRAGAGLSCHTPQARSEIVLIATPWPDAYNPRIHIIVAAPRA